MFHSACRDAKYTAPAVVVEAESTECVKLLVLGVSSWSSSRASPEEGDFVEHCGDPGMPIQMRLLGEQVYGRGPGGQSGAKIIRQMMATEVVGNRKVEFFSTS